MFWNYRVVHEEIANLATDTTDDSYLIYEIYYHKDGTIMTWSTGGHIGMPAGGDTLDVLRADLHLMLGALDKPVLEQSALPGYQDGVQ